MRPHPQDIIIIQRPKFNSDEEECVEENYEPIQWQTLKEYAQSKGRNIGIFSKRIGVQAKYYVGVNPPDDWYEPINDFKHLSFDWTDYGNGTKKIRVFRGAKIQNVLYI